MSKDQSIIEQAKKGSQKAFSTLFHKYYDRVFLYACTKTNCNEMQSKDASLVAFQKAFANLDKFETGTNFLAWVIIITRNHIADTKRANQTKKRRMVYLRLDRPYNDMSLYEAIPDESPSPMETLERNDTAEIVRREILKLPDSAKLFIIMRFYEGLGFREISELTGSPTGSISSGISYGKRILKEKLKSYG